MGISTQAGQNYIDLDWDKQSPALYFNGDTALYREPSYTVWRKSGGQSDYTAIKTGIKNNTAQGDIVPYSDRTAKDINGPDKPVVSLGKIKNEENLKLIVKTQDKGTLYNYYVQSEEAFTNSVTQEVKTGVKGFSWIIDENSNTDPGTTIKTVPNKISLENKGKYLHIRAIDWAENPGGIAHILIDEGRFIPEEELDEDKELFCIQHGRAIPARVDESYLNATLRVNAVPSTYSFIQQIDNPQNGDIVGRIFVEGTTVNPYGTKDIISYSIGRYHVSDKTPLRQPGKEGNAKEKEAYILCEYKNNTNVNSDVQKAMYTTEISKDNVTWDLNETDESKALAAEANAYEAYRKAGYNPANYKLYTQSYMSKDYNKIMIGPLKLKYTPKGFKSTEREEVYFANIIGAKIYDQNGSVIGEKDKNGNNIGSLKWEFVYTTQGAKRTEDLFSYNKYKFPVGDEEFYIELTYSDVLDNVTAISKLEFEHQELIADAQYDVLEGTYNKISWRPNRITSADKDVLWCYEGTTRKPCAHGKTTSHIIGGYFYLTANIFKTDKGIESQRLLDLEWAKKYYNNFIQTIVPGEGVKDPYNPYKPDEDEGDDDGWKITISISGNVWDDGLEDLNNGIREDIESGIEKIKVIAYKVDENGNRTGVYYWTYTDSYGDYLLKNMSRGMYDLEFEYDGQTYMTTKLLVGSKEVNYSDYKESPNKRDFNNNSTVSETKIERQNLNNNFEEIAGNKNAYGASGRIGLEYTRNEKESKLVTLNNDGYVKDEFKLYARTSSTDLYYPGTKTKTINGISYIKIRDIKNANLGLAQRQKTNESLKIDVYESTFVMKEEKQSFLHSGRNIRDINSKTEVEEYVQYVNRADYNWRWDSGLSPVWQTAEECELEAYVDYMMIIRNSGEKDFVRITEIADYYDKTLEYASKYRDYDITSWAVLRPDNPEESGSQIIAEVSPVIWKENSRYGGVTNPYSAYYNKMYTNSLEVLELSKGYHIELHIVFKVKKDENNNIMLDETGEGKKNFAEINGYKTYYVSDRSIAGLVDINSEPGNLNPLNDKSTYEDDEDKAPDYKLKLDPTTEENEGELTEEEKEQGHYIDENGIKRDKDGNIVGYGNVVEGNVWDDLRSEEAWKEIIGEENWKNIKQEEKESLLKTLENRQVIADGIRQKEEPLVDKVKVELIEIFENKKTGARLERIRTEQRTQNELSLSNNGKLNGTYRFGNLPTGKYRVEFTYGDKEQLMENMKYNGQDYQGVNTEDIYKNEELTRSYSDLEIILSLDVSNSMAGDSIDKVKTATKQLIEDLSKKLPGVKIGLVDFNNIANELVQPTEKTEETLRLVDNLSASGNTSIGRGITSAVASYSEEALKKILIILTDGEETVENNETVIKELERAADEGKIEIVSILTKEAKQIFGTEETPRRGKVFSIEGRNTEEIIKTIYEEAMEASVIRTNRSYGRDVEGDEVTEGTRIHNMKAYETMGIKEGERLDVKEIEKKEGKDKENAVEEFEKDTWMKAVTEEVRFRANNTNISKIEQVNLALRKRPEVELTMESEIEAIKVVLSDGKVIIDTEKGINKNVNGLDKEELPVSIYIDEELMHGATLIVRYKIRVTNTGEIDRMKNYVVGASGDTISTTAEIVYNYASRNMLYRAETGNSIWDEIKLEEASNYINGQTLKEVKDNGRKVYKTEVFKKALYPVGSVEAIAANNENTYIERRATMSKIISPQDEDDTLTYDSAIEVIQRYNKAGRRSYTSIPGNYLIEKDGTEPDTTITRKIYITKPLGEQNEISRYVLALIILVLTAVVILILKEKTKLRSK